MKYGKDTRYTKCVDSLSAQVVVMMKEEEKFPRSGERGRVYMDEKFSSCHVPALRSWNLKESQRCEHYVVK